jgi:hypothetical protein
MAQLLVDFVPLLDPLGYRRVLSPAFGCEVIRRNGRGNLQNGQPLRGDEYRRFASTARDAEGALAFVRCYGAFTPITGHGALGEPVSSITKEAGAMSGLLTAIASAPRPFPGKLRNLLSRLMGFSVWTEMVWDSKGAAPVWRFRPNTLRDALWLQFGQAVTAGIRVRSCLRCGTWFEAGTDRRADAKFCSDAHRMSFNSLKRTPARRRGTDAAIYKQMIDLANNDLPYGNPARETAGSG